MAQVEYRILIYKEGKRVTYFPQYRYTSSILKYLGWKFFKDSWGLREYEYSEEGAIQHIERDIGQRNPTIEYKKYP